MKPRRAASTTRGFTLVELLTSIAILAILSASALFAMFRANQQARLARTRTQIGKINELLMLRWEAYRARAIRMRPPSRLAGETPQAFALRIQRTRLAALRDLMRMELPERITDVLDPPAVPGMASPSLRTAYLNQVSASWTPQHQFSECLYLILSVIRDGESSALDYFRTSEIGDIDNDGMKEILDGFGSPIYFLRWAPGFSNTPGPDGKWGFATIDDDNDGIIDNAREAGWIGSDDVEISFIQTRSTKEAPDPLDRRRVDPYWHDANIEFDPFSLIPLVFSPGEDKEYGLYVENGTNFHYALTRWAANPAYPVDPYVIPPGSNVWIGTLAGGGESDNVFNHNLETKGIE